MDNLLIKDVLSLTTEKFIQEFGVNKCFNFYDWFCRDESLKNKARELFGKVKKFVKSNKMFDFDGKNVSVFFKNNCPCYGDNCLYDSFTFSNEDDNGVVLCWVAPRNPYGFAELSFPGHGFGPNDEGLYFNSFKDLCDYIANPSNFKTHTYNTYGRTFEVLEAA